MSSLLNVGRALKNQGTTKNLVSVVIRHGSGSRGREINSTGKDARFSTASANGNACGGVPLTQVRYLPTGNNNMNKVSDKTIQMPCKHANELTGTAGGGVNGAAGGNNWDKVVQMPPYGRRLKRSSETIRHDKLYLQRSDISQRQYKQTWNDFHNKRTIPNTEWGPFNRWEN